MNTKYLTLFDIRLHSLLSLVTLVKIPELKSMCALYTKIATSHISSFGESVPSEVIAVANKVAITRLYIRVFVAGYSLCRIFRDAVKVWTQMRLAEVPDRVQGCKIVIPTIRRQFKP